MASRGLESVRAALEDAGSIAVLCEALGIEAVRPAQDTGDDQEHAHALATTPGGHAVLMPGGDPETDDPGDADDDASASYDDGEIEGDADARASADDADTSRMAGDARKGRGAKEGKHVRVRRQSKEQRAGGGRKRRRSRSRGARGQPKHGGHAHPAPGGVRRVGGAHDPSAASDRGSSTHASTATPREAERGGVPLVTQHDINALQVICNPSKKWTLPINTDHINLSWVFRRKAGVGDGANGEGWGAYAGSSPAKSQQRGATPTPTRAADDAAGALVAAGTPSSSSQDPAPAPTSPGAESGASRGPPKAFRTLDNFDENYLIDCRKRGVLPAKRDALITSPRSALIILRNGLTVQRLCRVPREDLVAETSLEGVSKRVEKSREHHLEHRRAAQLASLKRMYEVARNTISREQLADMVWESSQTPKSRALNTISTAYHQSQHGGGSAASPAGATHTGAAAGDRSEQRSQRLVKEKFLGLPTAPLVYDTDMQLMVGQIKARSLNKATRELMLRKRQMDVAAQEEKACYEREQKAAQELQQQRKEREHKAVEHVGTVRQHTEELRRRAQAVKVEEELRRQRTIERLEKKERQTEERLESERQHRAEKQARHREMIENRRKKVKRQSVANVQNHIEQALARQRDMDEQHERDTALREARLVEQKAERQRRNEERNQRAKENAILMQEQFRLVMKMKEERSEQQIAEFRKARSDFHEAKKKDQLLKDIRGTKIRNQAEGRFGDWMETIVERARLASEEAERAAEARALRLETIRETERQKANDRRAEKERLGNAQQYRNIALLETQVQKHQTLECQKDQRAAASLQARSIQDQTRAARQTALETLEARELQAQKERAYLLQNSLTPKFEATL